MPGLRPRHPLIALALLLAAGAAGRAALLMAAEDRLQQLGISWQTRETGLLWARWGGLEGPGLRADALRAALLPSPTVWIEAPELDLAAQGALPGGAGGDGGGGWPTPAVEVHDLRLRWGEQLLAEGLSGPLLPSPDLRGEGVRLAREGDRWTGELATTIDLRGLAGEARLRFELAERARVWLELPAATLTHPALSTAPVGPLALSALVEIERDGAFEAEGRLGELQMTGRGALSLEPRQLDLQLRLGPAPFEDVLALFGDQVPEAARATVGGTLGLELSLHGPPWRWRAVPSADALSAEGAVPALDALRAGPLTWSAPAAEGGLALRTTGEGTPGWVPLQAAGRMPAAAVAAEDAHFWQHPGYDLAAIQEALDAWAAGEERPRGGSTITQQLAKNLFLDGSERTLVRKLRELVLAVELDRRLGKPRVLELYLNVVELGPGVYGVGPAAEAWFLKSPAGLSWKEAALLAAILPAPRTFWQTGLIEGRPPQARVDRVIDNLVRLDRLPREEAARARAEPLVVIPPPQ